jgi:tryptophanyl-tRNA synthetase
MSFTEDGTIFQVTGPERTTTEKSDESNVAEFFRPASVQAAAVWETETAGDTVPSGGDWAPHVGVKNKLAVKSRQL